MSHAALERYFATHNVSHKARRPYRRRVPLWFVLEVLDRPRSLNAVATLLDVPPDRARGLLAYARKRGFATSIKGGAVTRYARVAEAT